MKEIRSSPSPSSALLTTPVCSARKRMIMPAITTVEMKWGA